MDPQPHRKAYPIIPAGEYRCVWMNAGLLAYQICNHPSDCDNCPLDAALRTRYAGPGAGAAVVRETRIEAAGYSGSLPDEYEYHLNHCWQKRDRMTVRVGIEPTLASALLVPKSVVLPTVGQKIRAGQPCVWIIMEDGTFPITAVADGEVTALNSAVTNEPQEVFLHPLGNGWLYEFIPAPDTLRGIDRYRAAEYYRNDAEQFQALLQQAMSPDSQAVGVTLADGGKPLQNASSILGPKKYCIIVRDAFSGKPV